MSDIFISYKREEQLKARKLADALEKKGWSVWWDPQLRAGEHFDDAIEKALKDASCVIVMWSKLSVKSRYVKNEATYALENHKLVPVAIEEVNLPISFRYIQSGELINWDGSESFIGFQKLVDDIKNILGEKKQLFDSERYLEKYTHKFIGREWVFDKINSFLEQDEKRIMFISGEPGIGKSAIAASLIKRYKVSAYHFCIARHSITLHPRNFVENLSLNLSKSINGFAKILANSSETNINLSVKNAYVQLVLNPLNSLSRENKLNRVVIIIDGLDEAVCFQEVDTIVDLLSSSQKDIPKKVYLILTSRFENRVLRYFKDYELIKADSPENLLDIAKYIKNRVEEEYELQEILSQKNLSKDQFVKIGLKASGGNFLYCTYLIDGLVSKNMPFENIHNLPQGLEDIYRVFLQTRSFGQKTEDSWQDEYCPLIGILAASQEPLTFNQLKKLTSLNGQKLYFLLGDIEQFLVPTRDSNKKYQFWHRSFVDFICDKRKAEEFWIDIIEFHKKIVDFYLTNFNSRWSDCDLYGLNNLPIHLISVLVDEFDQSYFDKLYHILTDFTFLELKAATGEKIIHRITIKYAYYDGIYKIIDDLQLAIDKWPQNNKAYRRQKKILASIKNLLTQKAHILSQHPELIFQLIYNHSSRGLLANLTEHWLCQNKTLNHPWLRKLNRPHFSGSGIRLLGHHCTITRCTFMENGRFLLSIADEDPVHVWDSKTGRLITTIECKKDEGNRARFKDIAATDTTVGILEQQKLYLIYPSDWKPIPIEFNFSKGARKLVASKDKFFLIVGNEIWILNETGSIEQQIVDLSHLLGIEDIDVTPDGLFLACVDQNGMLIVLRFQESKWVPYIEVAIQYEQEQDCELSLRPLNQWNRNKQKYAESFKIKMSPDGQLLLICLPSLRIVQIFDLITLESISNFTNKRYYMLFATMSPDGIHAVFPGDWMASFKPINLFNISNKESQILLLPHSEHCSCASFTPDAQFLAVGSWDHTISIVSIDDAQLLDTTDKEFQLSRDEILGCIISMDKKKIACWSIDHTVSVWDLESGKLLFVTERLGDRGNDRICNAGFSPGNEYIYVKQGRLKDSRLTIWRVSTNEIVFDTEKPDIKRFYEVRNRFSCAFSQDGMLAAVVTHLDVFVINLETQQIKDIIPFRHGNIETKLFFNNNGDLIVVDGNSGAFSSHKPFILRPKADSFIESEVTPSMQAIDNTGIYPCTEMGSLSISKNSMLGYVDDKRPGEELLAYLNESGKTKAIFPAEGRITYIGLIPGTKYSLVGDATGTISILKYEE